MQICHVNSFCWMDLDMVDGIEAGVNSQYAVLPRDRLSRTNILITLYRIKE